MSTDQPDPRLDLRVTVEPRPGVDVVCLVGSVDLTTVAAVREVALDPARCGQPVLALDLNDTGFLDSQGIATIVAVRRHVLARGGELVLVCAQPHLLKLLRISRLDTVLRVVATLDELLAPVEVDDIA
jgi:anti-sigma B factor antagonist